MGGGLELPAGGHRHAPPPGGVLLNVAPDHLDRHGSFEEYLRCKLRIFENQLPGDTAVVNGDDPALRDVDLPGRGERVTVTRADAAAID